eukprot:3023309-Amphidinium_carterae.1
MRPLRSSGFKRAWRQTRGLAAGAFLDPLVLGAGWDTLRKQRCLSLLSQMRGHLTTFNDRAGFSLQMVASVVALARDKRTSNVLSCAFRVIVGEWFSSKVLVESRDGINTS